MALKKEKTYNPAKLKSVKRPSVKETLSSLVCIFCKGHFSTVDRSGECICGAQFRIFNEEIIEWTVVQDVKNNRILKDWIF